MLSLRILFMTLALTAVMAVAQDGGKIATIQVVPGKKVIYSGQKFRFFAFAYNKYNQKVPFSAEWSATGGAITDDGWYTAGNREAVYSVMATDPNTGAQGSATVMIHRSPSGNTGTSFGERITRLQISPTRIELAPLEKIQFSVRAYNKGGQLVEIQKLLWKVTGGSVTGTGSYQAGGAPGKYLVEVRVPNGAAATAEVIIRGNIERVASLKIFPSGAKLKPYEEHRFFVTAFNTSGSVVQIAPRWQATGGSINQYGIYRAGAVSGTYFVKAIAPGGVSSTSTVVIETVHIHRVEVQPQSVILYPGQMQKFRVRAYDVRGHEVPAFSVWSAEGGEIDAEGTYRAGPMPGRYLLTVTVGQISVERHVLIRAGSRPTNLTIQPKNVRLQPGQTVQFTATAYSEQGQPVSTQIRWQVQGGSIDASGLYRAGAMPGAYFVRALLGNGTFVDSTVVITSHNAYEQVARLTISPNQLHLKPGESVTFYARGFNHSGREIPCAFSWRTTGGTITANGRYQAGAVPGTYQVVVSATSGVNTTATVNIIGPHQAAPAGVSLKVKPKKAIIEQGGTCTFHVALVDSYGRALSGRFQWQATGGTIDADGNYQAGNEPGKYAVIVTDLTTGISCKVAIKITIGTKKPKIKPFKVLEWKIGNGNSTVGKIFIKAQVNADNAYLLKLVLIRTNGVEKILAQRRASAGYTVTFQGNYIRSYTRMIAVVLADAELQELHRWQRKP